MESYERWFEGKPELDILRLMGLFDRPAASSALDALRKKPAIQSLSSNLQSLSHADWQYAVENLCAARLLSAPDPNEPDTLDCHPLLREHFADKLRASNPKAWREAHSRLYEYYKSSAKEYPDTIEEMAPLYAAVAHGCYAGRHRESLSLYRKQIKRGDNEYSTRKLGAYGADLVALSSFFETQWDKVAGGIKATDRAYLLAWTGFALRALGRLDEACQPMQQSLQDAIKVRDWKNAAIAACNLSQISLELGVVPDAVASARQGVQWADRSRDIYTKMGSRTILADVLHKSGELLLSEQTFREAEMLKKQLTPEWPQLWDVPCFWFCDLLLSEGKLEEVQERASRSLEFERQHGFGLLSIALHKLSMGRTALHRAQEEGTATPLREAGNYMDDAVQELREARYQEFVALGLMGRAVLHRVKGELDKARRDLDEPFSIATRGGMRLHEADCHLEYARWYLASGEKDKAREHWVKAKRMVEEMGYHRRDGEVKELEDQL